MHPADLSVVDAGAALRDGSLSSEALTQAHLDRIAERDPEIGAFVHLAPAETLSIARTADAALAAADDRGPLHGIPFAIKDLIDVAGWPIRHGARAHADRVATETAPVVRRLLEAGAVPLGIVATYDLGIVGPGHDGAYPQPRNPWNPAHVTGGSSSGSAAAVAAGMVRVALGTDTGGSIRSPSAYCGAVGLKPTFGSLPRDNVLPLAPSLDHVGPIGRSVGDVARIWQVLSGRKADDPDALDGFGLGYARDWVTDDAAHPDLASVMDAAASDLSLCGAGINLVPLPGYALMEAAAAILLHAEGFDLHRARMAGAGSEMGRMAYRSMAGGASLSPEDIADARRAAATLRREIDTVLTRVDALILPTTLRPAPAFSDFDDGKTVWTPMRTIPFNMTGHPALSLPMGFADGLPLALQIVGRHGDEARLLRIAAAYEAATDHGAHDPFRVSAPI